MPEKLLPCHPPCSCGNPHVDGTEINLDTFLRHYSVELEKAMTAEPDKYRFGLEGLPAAVERMRVALKTKTYSKDSDTIKAVCKTLHLKHTYTAINTYLGVFS